MVPVVRAPQPLDFKIEGDNLPLARVRLKFGWELYAEAGRCLQDSQRAMGDALERQPARREILGRDKGLAHLLTLRVRRNYRASEEARHRLLRQASRRLFLAKACSWQR